VKYTPLSGTSAAEWYDRTRLMYEENVEPNVPRNLRASKGTWVRANQCMVHSHDAEFSVMQHHDSACTRVIVLC